MKIDDGLKIMLVYINDLVVGLVNFLKKCGI